MSTSESELKRKLWDLRKTMDGNFRNPRFQNYLFGFITYKFLSEKSEHFFKDKPRDISSIENHYDKFNYYISPESSFNMILDKAKKGDYIIDDLNNAFDEIMKGNKKPGEYTEFANLFEDVDLDSSKLGPSPADRNIIVFELLSRLNEIDFDYNNNTKNLNNAFDYLMNKYAQTASRRGISYTPKELCVLLSKLVTDRKENIVSVYDPTCGPGSLLLNVGKEANVKSYFGQELNTSTCNLARMNMLIHDVDSKDFNIAQGDIFTNPAHMGKKFEVIVSDIPFLSGWGADDSFLDDPRFSAYGKLAPKSKSDFAFVQHMIYHLADDGVMAVVLPHGVLFRRAAEKAIREYMVGTKNYLDAVIGLPGNMLYGTSIPTCVLIFKKERTDEDVLFIDASKCYEKEGRRNYLTEEHIARIVETYSNREVIDKFSNIVTIKELAENDFNLNIPRYVDSFEEEEPVNLDVEYNKHKELSKELIKVDKDIEECCKKLGIKNPILKK